MSTSTMSPLLAAIVALVKTEAGERELNQLLANLPSDGPAKPKGGSKAKKAKKAKSADVTHVRKLCSDTRLAFIAAAAKDGHDFAHWSKRKIAQFCITEGYTPSGFAIGEGYRQMFADQPQETGTKKAKKAKAKKAKHEAVEVAEVASEVVETETRKSVARLRAADGRYLPSRNTEGLTPQVVDEMIAFCKEKGIEPIGTAWDELRAGERRSRVLRARNKRDGITPPEPMDARVVSLVRAGWSQEEAAKIVATLG